MRRRNRIDLACIRRRVVSGQQGGFFTEIPNLKRLFQKIASVARKQGDDRHRPAVRLTLPITSPFFVGNCVRDRAYFVDGEHRWVNHKNPDNTYRAIVMTVNVPLIYEDVQRRFLRFLELVHCTTIPYQSRHVRQSWKPMAASCFSTSSSRSGSPSAPTARPSSRKRDDNLSAAAVGSFPCPPSPPTKCLYQFDRPA